MSARLRHSWALLISAAIVLQAAPSAAEPTAADKDKARTLLLDGREKLAAGDAATALKKFQEAHAIMGVTTTGLDVAKAQIALGLLMEARATALAVSQIPATPGEPTAFTEARAEAGTLVQELEERIPSFVIAVKGLPEGATANVRVDGVVVPQETAGLPRKVNPGEHTVTVSAEGRATATRTVTFREKDAAQVVVELAPSVPPPPTARPAAEAAASEPPATPSERRYVVPAIAAFGVAGVAAGVGIVTGAMSLSKVGSLDEVCPNHTCYDDAGDAYDSAYTLGTVSTVGFVLCGVATAAGVTLLLWPEGDEAPAQVGLRIAPGAVLVKGNF